MLIERNMASKLTDREQLADQICLSLLQENLTDALVIGSRSDLFAAYDQWHTFYKTSSPASPLPTQTKKYHSIIVRLPKSHKLFDFFLHVVRAYADHDAAIFVYGYNDEGIKGAQKKCADFFGMPSEIIGYKKRCRVFSVSYKSKKSHITAPKLNNFSENVDLIVDNSSYPTVYYPGMFAQSQLDKGTNFLLTHPPVFSESGHILDYGCGSGIIARHTNSINPSLTWDLLDIDTLSLEAARINCSDISVDNFILDHQLPVGKKYNHIISNPPMHTEKEEHTDVINHLISESPTHLHAGGSLIMVVQSRLKIDKLLEKNFSSTKTIADNNNFKSIQAYK